MNSRSSKTIAMAVLLLFALEFHMGVTAEQGERIKDTIIGEAANDQAASNPERTIFDVNRLIGRSAEVKVFTTYQDHQTTVEIKVRQGERNMTKNCIELGKFTLSGIPPAPRGGALIDVTFEVDGNGTIRMTAEDKARNNKQSITITNEEIERRVEESKQYEDRMARERGEAKNKLESYICNMKSTFDELKRALKDAVKWLEENAAAEKEELEEKMKEVEAVCNPVIQKAYENSAGA